MQNNYNFSRTEAVLQEKTSGLILGNLEQIGNKIDNITQDIMKISSIVSSNSVIASELSERICKDISVFETKELQTLGIEDIIKVSEVQKQINYFKSNFFNYNIHVIILGADGNIYSSLDTVNDEVEFNLNFLKKYESQNWYNLLRTGKETGVWTVPYSYEIDGFGSEKRYISLARIMKDNYTQNVQGIIMVNFSEENFKRTLGSDINGIITLLNNDKQIIFKSDSGQFDNQVNFKEVYAKIPSQGKGYFSTEIKNKKYLLNYYSIDKIGWSLVSVIPYDDVMKEVSMNKGEDEITIEKELELAKSYVYIQNIRFNDKYKLTFQVDEHVEGVKILKLLLQPIVENAIIHGLKNKTSDGEINISTMIKEDRLIVIVKDNGVGISKDKIDQIFDVADDPKQQKYSRIGLINIHERLKIKYGSTHQ